MRTHGVDVYLIDTYEKVDEFVNEICAKRLPRDSHRLDQKT
jgi:hypothetical protein